MNPRQIKIAVVSSDDTHLAATAEVLENKGYQVARLTSAQQALSDPAAQAAHVVLVDQDLPGDVDGLGLLGQLREANRQHSAILTASQPNVDVAVKGMQLGACDLLNKPADGDRLLKSVELALGRRGMFLTSPETINKIIGARLRDIRRDSDLTTQQLADRVGVTQSQISQIETGRSAASVVTLYRIAHALGLTLAKLLDGI